MRDKVLLLSFCICMLVFRGLKLHSLFSLLTRSTCDPYFHLAVLGWVAAPAVNADIRYICFPLNSCKNREVNRTVISSSVDATLILQANLNRSLDKHFRPKHFYMVSISVSNFYLYLYSVLKYLFEAELALSESPQKKKKKYFCVEGCVCWLSILLAALILDLLLPSNLQADTRLLRKSWCEPRSLRPGAVMCAAAPILSI